MTRKLQKKKGRTKVDIKNMVWKPTFDVIVSDCELKSFVFSTRIRKSN